MKQLQIFFQKCNYALKRNDDSEKRGEKVYYSILKRKEGSSIVTTNDVADWLKEKFSKTPAVLHSFYEIAKNIT